MREYQNIVDKSERINFIRENREDIIRFKKANIGVSDTIIYDVKNSSNKALITTYADNSANVITRDIIGNTYNWMDSHDDVHVGNTFKKSITEKRASDIFFLQDHKREVDKKLGKFISIKEVEVDWVDLGVYELGKTTVLLATANIEKERNPTVFRDYLLGEQNQHSVGMQYVQIKLALNSESKEDIEEKATWDKYINQIGNRQKAIKQGYFFAVTEAKLIEISAVLQASNELTFTVPNEVPTKVTPKYTIDNALIEIKNYKYI